MTFTLLDETRPATIDATVGPDGIRLASEVVEEVLGWELKPQGLCRGERCIALPPGAPLRQDGDVDLTELASLLGRPLVLDVDERAACLGVAAEERASRLRSLEAPEFTLPDVDGRPFALSGFRGKKVLLITWASW